MSLAVPPNLLSSSYKRRLRHERSMFQTLTEKVATLESRVSLPDKNQLVPDTTVAEVKCVADVSVGTDSPKFESFLLDTTPDAMTNRMANVYAHTNAYVSNANSTLTTASADAQATTKSDPQYRHQQYLRR